jgi:hypothetical protein
MTAAVSTHELLAYRPLLCLALALLIGLTSSDSTLIRGLYTFCLLNPGSTTYTIPSIVKDVSAILVDTTTLRPGGPPGYLGPGASLNIYIIRKCVI